MTREKRFKSHGGVFLFCKNCGAKQGDDAGFCHSCGEKLTHENSRQQENVHHDVSTGEAAGNESSPTPDQQSNEEQIFHDLVNLYVGDQIGYYQTKWKKGKISWNWPGFFVSLFWLGYRRMYGVVFAIIGFYLLLDIVDFVFEIDLSNSTQIGMVVAVVIGMNGNQLYQEHVKRQVKKIQQQYGDQAPEVIQEKGGPSWGGFWISVLAFVGYALIAAFLLYP